MTNALVDKIKSELYKNFKPPKAVYKFTRKTDPDGCQSLEYNLLSEDWEIVGKGDPLIDLIDHNKNFTISSLDGKNFKHSILHSYTVNHTMDDIYRALERCVEDAIRNDKIPMPKTLKKKADWRRHPAVIWFRYAMRVENHMDEKTADSIIKLYKLLQDANQDKTHIALVLVAIYESTNKEV